MLQSRFYIIKHTGKICIYGKSPDTLYNFTYETKEDVFLTNYFVSNLYGDK